MENTAVERLHIRLKEVSLQDAKQQLQQHLDETREQQKKTTANVDGTLKKKGLIYHYHLIHNL